MNATATARPSMGKLAAAIAEHMPGWRLEPREEESACCAALVRDDGAAVTFYLAGYGPQKIEVSGRYPRSGSTCFSPRDRSRIGVSAAKAPAAIARDVERRFLGSYLTAYAEGLADKAEHDAGEAAADAVASKLAAVLGVETSRSLATHGCRDRTVYWNAGDGSGYGNARVSAERVALDFQVTPEQAERMLRALVETP